MAIGHEGMSIRQHSDNKRQSARGAARQDTDLVFDKSIFSSIFYKDIRRVYIYKKAERLASALYLVGPAFAEAPSLRAKLEEVALALTDSARLAPARLADAVSRELLALSSLLSMAQAGGLLSAGNAGLINGEVRALLAEVALYEEPRIALPETATLPALARELAVAASSQSPRPSAARPAAPARRAEEGSNKGHISQRQDSILSYIKDKGSVSIRDLASIVRGVSEKTIQRELQALIESGQVVKRGERRWSTYSLS